EERTGRSGLYGAGGSQQLFSKHAAPFEFKEAEDSNNLFDASEAGLKAFRISAFGDKHLKVPCSLFNCGHQFITDHIEGMKASRVRRHHIGFPIFFRAGSIRSCLWCY